MAQHESATSADDCIKQAEDIQEKAAMLVESVKSLARNAERLVGLH